jgi:hypothetical protein
MVTKMTYDGALVMPRNCVTMSEDEMTYMDGGVSIPIHRMFLDKGYCNTYAQIILSHYPSIGLGKTRIAKELYAHAWAYYHYYTICTIVGITIANGIKQQASIVHIGGDSQAMVNAFGLIWNLA